MKQRIYSFVRRWTGRAEKPPHDEAALPLGVVTLEVQQLRERVNHLAVEVFNLTTEIDELHERFSGPDGHAATSASRSVPSEPPDGLEAFHSERSQVEPSTLNRKVGRGRARRGGTGAVRPVAPSVVAPEPTPGPELLPAAGNGTAARVGAATGLAALLLVGLVGIFGQLRMEDWPLSATETMPSALLVDQSPAEVEMPARQTRRVPRVRPAAPTGLSVSRFGLGTDVIDRELVGRSTMFPPGRPVLFWTHVMGGRPGDTIRHVWSHEGDEVVSIALPVESDNWRTHSRFTFGATATGKWVVEARDREDRILARAQFTGETPGALRTQEPSKTALR